MITCIIHSTNCPNAAESGLNARGVLLLWPGTLGLISEKPRALSWLRVWIEQEKFEVEELQTSTDDALLCELSFAVNRNAILVADITLRDPHVYFGISLAQATLKPILLLADSRVEGVGFPEVITYQSSGSDTSAATSKAEEFERMIRARMKKMKEFNPPQRPPRVGSVPKIDGKQLQDLFSKDPGKRTQSEINFLRNTWAQILDLCKGQRPDPEWDLASDWSENAHYDKGLLKIYPPLEDFRSSKQLLVDPTYRQNIEHAIYEMTSTKINWTLKIEDFLDLTESDD